MKKLALTILASTFFCQADPAKKPNVLPESTESTDGGQLTIEEAYFSN